MATKLNVLFLLAAAVLAASLHCSTAQRTHIVGDSLGWTFPPAGAVAYTTWASTQTFTVGDILVFNFATGSHDVAEVSSSSFDSCTTSNTISFTGTGPANITLSAAGQHFFICTFAGHCGGGQKLAISVSAAPSTSPAPQPAATPSPAPTPVPTPSPAPTTSPAPSPSRAPQTYVVGDSLGWTFPPGGAIAYQTWAANKTFFVGDVLVFNFTTGQHNVATSTSKAAYNSCDTSATGTPITTGPARVTLTTPGENLYICTFARHCAAGMKLAVNVSRTASTPASSPGPATARPPSSPPTAPSSPSATPPPAGSTTPSPDGASAPPPPSSAPSFSGAALPITFLAVALAFFV